MVVVNFNTGTHLARCLASLPAALRGVDWRAVVVDNASRDGSESAAEHSGPAVALVRSQTNIGFSRAANLGAATSASDFILFLNPDAALRQDAIVRLVDDFHAHPGCAVVGPNVLNEDGSAQGSARRDPWVLTAALGRAGVVRRLFPNSLMAKASVVRADSLPTGEVSREVDWVSGCCMLVRREAFKDVGGFDEGYFLYWEDADICRRIRQSGWTVRFRVDAEAVHAVGCSSGGVEGLAVDAFHASAYRYYARHIATSPYSPRRWLAWVALQVRRHLLRAVRRRRGNSVVSRHH